VSESRTRTAIPVIDYEGSRYRVDFWEAQGRNYEDAAERLALRQLLPADGVRIAEIGAGFGRLAELYTGYEQIILFDYSRTLLVDAACKWGTDPRFVFVAGNIYDLPLAEGILDTLVMVRVMHHLADVPAALAQLQRLLHRRSVAVLEFANKRNMKALLRWGLRRQEWSPMEREPVEFIELHYDFHPEWMAERLAEAGLVVRRRLGVSHFRQAQIKARVAGERLAQWDSRLFALGGAYPLAPSVFIQATTPAAGQRPDVAPDPDQVWRLFRCPTCKGVPMTPLAGNRVRCTSCGALYGKHEGVWDFKEAIR
jgi:SAM-dependent methyltransferase